MTKSENITAASRLRFLIVISEISSAIPNSPGLVRIMTMRTLKNMWEAIKSCWCISLSFLQEFNAPGALPDVAVDGVNANQGAFELGDLSRVICRQELFASIVLSEEGNHWWGERAAVPKRVNKILEQGVYSDLKLKESASRQRLWLGYICR